MQTCLKFHSSSWTSGNLNTQHAIKSRRGFFLIICERECGGVQRGCTGLWGLEGSSGEQADNSLLASQEPQLAFWSFITELSRTKCGKSLLWRETRAMVLGLWTGFRKGQGVLRMWHPPSPPIPTRKFSPEPLTMLCYYHLLPLQSCSFLTWFCGTGTEG